MKAIIMAGGEGTRLRPLTCDCPKPMVRLMDRPVMEYTLGLLQRSGITDIAVTLGYLPDAVQDYFGDGSDFGVHLRYYIEKEPLGTAGGVAQARDFLTETFVVLSGDGVTDLDILRAEEFHHQSSAEATLVLKRVENPLEYGVVSADPDGRIRSFHEKPGWGEVLSDAVNTGIYILEPTVLNRIPTDAPMDFGGSLFPEMLRDGCRMYGYVTDAYWCDIGDLNAYLKVHEDAMDQKIALPEFRGSCGIRMAEGAQVDHRAEIEAPCIISAGAQIHAGARIGSYSVIGENAVVRSGAGTKHGILWPGAQLMRGAQARGCVLARCAVMGESSQAYEGCVLGTESALGMRSVLAQGAMLWPEKYVPDGKRQDVNLVWGSRKDTCFSAGTLPLGTPSEASRAAQACAAALKTREFLLGRTPSSIACAQYHAVAAGLMAQGIQIVDAGICCMPQLRHALSELHCGAAALIGDDSMTLMDDTGAALSAKQRRSICAMLQRQDFAMPFSGITPPILSAGRTEMAYIAHVASCFDAETDNVPDIALFCTKNHILSLAEQAFARAGLNVRGEWEEEMMDLAPGEIGIWFSDTGESAVFADSDGKLSEAEQQLLTVWTALSLGERRILLPPGYTDGARILSQHHGATVQMITGDRNRWMREAARLSPLQFRLHFDGPYMAVCAVSALTGSGTTLTAWRKNMPSVHRRTASADVLPSMRGRVLDALARTDPDSTLEGGVRINRNGGWAWICADESLPLCHIVVEGTNAEFADELCDFCTKTIKRIVSEPQFSQEK